MNGFCAPNIITKDGAPPFTPETLDIVGAGEFRLAKLMHYHTLDHIAQLQGVGVSTFIQRFPELEQEEPFLKHAGNCVALIQSTYPAVKIWQTGNEPNDVTAWADKGWEYQFYMRFVMREIQTWCAQKGIVYGKDIQFILPPLSYAPGLWRSLNLWKSALTTRPDHEKRIPALSEYMQYAGANCYWQYPKFLLDGSYGMSWQDVHNFTGLPVHVLEYGYSAYLLGLSGNTLWRQMQLDYPSYVNETEKRGALSTSVFGVGLTSDWAGLSVPVAVAQAIARRPSLPVRPAAAQ